MISRRRKHRSLYCACLLFVLVACAGQPPARSSNNASVGASPVNEATYRLRVTDLTLGTGHRGPVSACAEIRRWKLMATGGCDGTVRLWANSPPITVATLGGHAGAIEALAVSDDGSLLATAAADGRVNIWSLDRGELVGGRAIAHPGWLPTPYACIESGGPSPPTGWKLAFDTAGALWLLDVRKASESGQKPEWLFVGQAHHRRFTLSTAEELLGHSARGILHPPMPPRDDLSPCRLDAPERERFTSRIAPWDRVIVSSHGERVVVAGPAGPGDPGLQRVHWFPLSRSGAYGSSVIELGRVEHVIDTRRGPVAVLREGTGSGGTHRWRVVRLEDGQVQASLASRDGTNAIAVVERRGLIFVRPDGSLDALTLDAALPRIAPPSPSNAISVSATEDGRYVAWSGADGTVTVWDSVLARRAGQLATRGAPATEMKFAANAVLAMRRSSGRVEVWPVTGNRVYEIRPAVAWDWSFASARLLRRSEYGFSEYMLERRVPLPRSGATFSVGGQSVLVRWDDGLGFFGPGRNTTAAPSWMGTTLPAPNAVLDSSGEILVHDNASGDVLATRIADGSTELLAKTPVGKILSLATVPGRRVIAVLGTSACALVETSRANQLYLDVVTEQDAEASVEFHPVAFSTSAGTFAGSPRALGHLRRRADQSLGPLPGLPVGDTHHTLAALISEFSSQGGERQR